MRHSEYKIFTWIKLLSECTIYNWTILELKFVTTRLNYVKWAHVKCAILMKITQIHYYILRGCCQLTET